ncbi:R body protein RebB-like protein, partial [Pseudomonas protegens]
LAQAATNQGVMQIYSVDTTAGASATEKVAQGGVADNLTSLLTVLKSFSS